MRRLLVGLSLCFISLVTTGVRTSEANHHEACWYACYDDYVSCSYDLCDGGKCPECVVPYHLCLENCG